MNSPDALHRRQIVVDLSAKHEIQPARCFGSASTRALNP